MVKGLPSRSLWSLWAPCESKVRFPRAAQISGTSRCSKMQILANCSSVAVSDLSSHFLSNHGVAPVHQAEIARPRQEGESGLISAKLLFCAQYRLSGMYFLQT